MKLVTYIRPDDRPLTEHLGVVTSDVWLVDLQAASQSLRGGPNPHFNDMVAFLSGRPVAQAEAQALADAAGADELVALSSVKLLAPVPRPRMMRDTACYEGHLVNGLRAAARMKGQNPDAMPPEAFKPPAIWYELPLYYKVNVNSIMGMDDEVAYPEGERFKDYELELAVVIGQEGRDIHARDAMRHVGGYTIFNDCSARLTQGKEMPNEFHVGPGLGKDFANPMGPCLVTADAFDPDNAVTITRVNGVE
ncbi:MAG: fumarylacetoacetate hydrolase family protein, partial [Rhodoferax sp.]